MWGMGKGSINRKQCNTPEELSVQAQAALAAITMSFVNGMLVSSSTRRCAVLVLSGQCLHGRRDVMRDLRHAVQTSEGIAHAREAQAKSLQGFVRGQPRVLGCSVVGGSASRFWQMDRSVTFPDANAAA
jgi:hypothetical protein